mgnify:CR=1 FL=1
MLQVVPHSDLGAVTNYMRGGIVIKFPLEFPYDTDIDKVRKIIKKVGIAMLEDPEIGDDFLQPVKSQGVYEITNSVMVIRVKFTAKPGKQFVIKREAFRRITEALNAKGIFYAHRKVIVDFPPELRNEKLDPDLKKKALEAGLKIIVVINKIDRQDARPHEVLDEIYDLLIDLDATEAQLDFPLLYAIGREGIAVKNPHDSGENLNLLFDAIVDAIPGPSYDSDAPFQMLVSDLGYSDYLGRLAVGKVFNGTARSKERLVRIGRDGYAQGAIVKNLSGGGFLLWLDDPVEVDSAFEITVAPTTPITPPLSARVKVVRCEEVPGSEGSYAVACAIAEVLPTEPLE